MPSDAETADFIRAQGMPFLAHLLRRISDRMVADAGAFYRRQGIRAPARTASLEQQGPQSVTWIAGKLRQSHPLVITWIRQLKKLGFVTVSVDPADRRRTMVALTREGRDESGRMAAALQRLGRAYLAVLSAAEADLFDPLWRLDDRLAAGALADELALEADEGP
jgi:DNA-binding MarR family transcriptional regulator